jgi:hypothetical protein
MTPDIPERGKKGQGRAACQTISAGCALLALSPQADVIPTRALHIRQRAPVFHRQSSHLLFIINLL